MITATLIIIVIAINIHVKTICIKSRIKGHVTMFYKLQIV